MSTVQSNRKSPRTFGDLKKQESLRVPHLSATCSFCKRSQGDGLQPRHRGSRKYSTRHYICDPCIELKSDELLPSVAKAERVARRLAKTPGISSARAVMAISGCSLEYAKKVWREARAKDPSLNAARNMGYRV